MFAPVTATRDMARRSLYRIRPPKKRFVVMHADRAVFATADQFKAKEAFRTMKDRAPKDLVSYWEAEGNPEMGYRLVDAQLPVED